MRGGTLTSRPLAQLLWPLAGGCLLASAFPTWNYYPLAWIALVPVFYVAEGPPLRSAAAFALAGYVFHASLLHWLAANVYWAGGWALLGHQLLSLYHAAYWFLFGLAWGHVRARFPTVLAPPLAGILWAAMEHILTFAFTGFGWSALAYSQGPNLAALQWAAIGGAPLIAFFMVTASAAAATAFRKQPLVNAAWIAVVLVGVHAGGNAFLGEPDYESRPFVAGIVQSNFPVEMKWDREYWDDMTVRTAEKSLDLAGMGAPIDLFVWPEALVMGSLDSLETREALKRLGQETGASVFTGGQRTEYEPRAYYNSGYLIDDAAVVTGIYDKVHLAPFGEYVPLAKWLPFVKQAVPIGEGLTPGKEQMVFDVDGRRLGPLICFEMLFPAMSERLRRDGADMLAVITNLSWFGMSSAIPQELDIARVRAIETRLPLIHSANTGISGVFDPWGRFSPMRIHIDANDVVYEFPEGTHPYHTRGERLVGAFNIPAPAQKPLPAVTAYVPMSFVALAIAAVLVGLVLPMRGAARP